MVCFSLEIRQGLWRWAVTHGCFSFCRNRHNITFVGQPICVRVHEITYLPKGSKGEALHALILFYLCYSAFRQHDIIDSLIIHSIYGNSQSSDTFEGHMEGFPSLISPPQKFWLYRSVWKGVGLLGKLTTGKMTKTVIRSLLCLFRIKFFSSMYC